MLQNDNGTIINVLKPNDLKGRPIIEGPDSPTQSIKFRYRKNSKTHRTIFNNIYKSRLNFIKQLQKTLNYEATLYSCDIDSLYTSIPIGLGLEAISYWLNSKSNLMLSRF